MSELAEEMVRDALNAVVRRDVDLAQKVLASDVAWTTTATRFSVNCSPT
jgi:phosphate uptake regulator